MIKKSYIKDKSYYDEADSMQTGWGDTLRHIDELKDKIQYQIDITLDEFCYSLYGDGYCSHCWQAFKLYCKRTLKYDENRLIQDAWRGIFDKWITTEYDSSNIYI
jgi:hypothetical protein